ncbi:Uma2 family endonuclease [Gloeomargaritales cyanobacterium VI4D9]|nr:Uma2 family endonuclease [Gloeomargaritales cyanobacterium VI4D9]
MTFTPSRKLIYPDSDGQPMADNTLQFRWIVLFKENLECLFRDNADVFVGGDLLWYPVEGHPEIRVAPDAMVVFNRPKGERGSYQQWEENGIAPQVVLEILSPGNRLAEMAKKLEFYEQYGVEEYYIYDPQLNELNGYQRVGNRLRVIEEINGWVSPRLGIRFELNPDELLVYYPNGKQFKTTVELAQELEQTQQELIQKEQVLEQTQEQLNQERRRANQEMERAEQERQRAERLAAYLRSQGVNPDEIGG